MQGSKYGAEAVLDEVFCHDDRLVFRGQKKQVKLDEQWGRVVPKTGEILLWWKPETDERLPATEMPEGPGWVACQGRASKIGKGLSVYAEGSFIDIRINSLWDDMRARYRVALDALVAATGRGILTYNPTEIRKADPKRERTENERRTEAVRNRFKRHWHAVEYEHDLIIPADIGLKLLEELGPVDMAGGKYPGMVYLKGYGRKGTIGAKCYDMKLKHGQDAVKLEITLRQDYLKRAGLKAPNEWEEQPDIQERISSTLCREWGIIFGMAKGAKSMLAERLRVPQSGMFEFMADTRNTLAQVMDRLERHDRDIEQLKRDTEQNRRDNEQLKRQAGLK